MARAGDVQLAASGYQRYQHGISRFLNASHASVAGTLYYGDGKTVQSFRADWQRPNRWEYGTGGRSEEISVGSTTCDENGRIWICFRLHPQLDVAQLVDRGILLPRHQFGLVGSHPPSGPEFLQDLRYFPIDHVTTTVISIVGHGDPWARVPGSVGGVNRADPRLSYYVGVLTASRVSGLPLSFHSTVTFFDHRWLRQQIRFAYGGSLAIKLPSGRSVPCPSWAPVGARCLSDGA